MLCIFTPLIAELTFMSSRRSKHCLYLSVLCPLKSCTINLHGARG